MPYAITTPRGLRNAFTSIQDAVGTSKITRSKEIRIYLSASHAINIGAFALFSLTNS
jgi:hypothetical protein